MDPQQALAHLRQRFVGGLPGRWALITSADPAVRDQALHQLAGAAGAYGLDTLGNAARWAEQCAAAGDAPGLDKALSSLHKLLQAQLPPGAAASLAARLAEQPHGRCSN
jgi:hypothetical protein